MLQHAKTFCMSRQGSRNVGNFSMYPATGLRSCSNTACISETLKSLAVTRFPSIWNVFYAKIEVKHKKDCANTAVSEFETHSLAFTSFPLILLHRPEELMRLEKRNISKHFVTCYMWGNKTQSTHTRTPYVELVTGCRQHRISWAYLKRTEAFRSNYP